MKNILCIIVLFTFSCQLNSQLSLIIEAGANQGKSIFLETDILETKNKYGYYFAVIPSFKIWRGLSINAEFQYSIEGFQGANNITPDFEYKYARFIPQVDYEIVNIVHLYAGYDLGYNISASSRSNGMDWVRQISGAKGVKDYDSGILVGARVEVRRISFSIKYNYGIADISDFILTDMNGMPIGTAIQKNRVLQFGLGYRIF